MKKVLLYGASTKTKLVVDFLKNEGGFDKIVGIIDSDSEKRGMLFQRLPVIGDISEVDHQYLNENSFCISLSEKNFQTRKKIHEQLVALGCSPISIISSTALISLSAGVEPGSIIFPGCTINAQAQIGKCVTLYTGVLIEHDCIISDNVEISPRSVLAGGVEVGEESFIGINATVLPFVKIGRNSIVGAGSVVTRDVGDNVVVVGNPARILSQRV